MKEITNWLKENKVCFVTNSIVNMPGSLFIHSFKTYCNYIPEENFIIINGIKDNKHFYGLEAFIEMLNTLRHYDFDYIIYLDEDCFIKDFDLLLSEFKKFKDGNYCLGGLQDGGMICHRNQSKILINTFLSFWNLKEIKKNFKNIGKYISDLLIGNIPYKSFLDELGTVGNESLKTKIFANAIKMINNGVEYRKENFKQEPPHATVVRNDPTNNYEPHQTPYSYKDNVYQNMEPYYLIEEAIVLATKLPIYYLFGSDLYTDQETKMDNSGITTVLMNDKNEPYAYHTWFARYYKPFMNTPNEVRHTARINTIIENL